MAEVTALGIPAAQHDAIIVSALERHIIDGAFALAYDRQEETFPGPSWRRHLDEMAIVLVEAMRAHRDAARERHDLLYAQLVMTAEQCHGGQHEPLRGVWRRQRTKGEVRVLERRNTQNVMSECMMPALLVAAQRWHGRICIHDPCP